MSAESAGLRRQHRYCENRQATRGVKPATMLRGQHKKAITTLEVKARSETFVARLGVRFRVNRG
jgi:hypothetical protein